MTGQFDQRGSNVLFAATSRRPVSGSALLPPEQSAKRLGFADHPLGPQRDPGSIVAADVHRAVLTGAPYPIKAVVSFGSDPLLGHSDPLLGKTALQQLEFYVHMDMVQNPSAAMADLLLPASTTWERMGLMASFRAGESGATWAQLKQPVVAPLYESWSDLEVIFELAQRLGLGEHFFGGDLEAAVNHELGPSGLTVQQLREHATGMRFAAETRYQKYALPDPASGLPRGFLTPTRKLEIYSTKFVQAGYLPLPAKADPVPPADLGPEFPLLLTFNRLVQFCDDQHRNIPRLRRQAPHPLLEIHPDTASQLGIGAGDWVQVETPTGRIQLKAKLEFMSTRSVVDNGAPNSLTSHVLVTGC